MVAALTPQRSQLKLSLPGPKHTLQGARDLRGTSSNMQIFSLSLRRVRDSINFEICFYFHPIET